MEILLFFAILTTLGAAAAMKANIIVGLIVLIAGVVMFCIGTNGLGYDWTLGLVMSGFCLSAASASVHKMIDGEWVTVEPAYLVGVIIGFLLLVVGGYLYIQ